MHMLISVHIIAVHKASQNSELVHCDCKFITRATVFGQSFTGLLGFGVGFWRCITTWRRFGICIGARSISTIFFCVVLCFFCCLDFCLGWLYWSLFFLFLICCATFSVIWPSKFWPWQSEVFCFLFLFYPASSPICR